MSDFLMLIAAEAANAAGHGAAGGHHAAPQPEVFGLGPVFWVSLAMLILIAIMLWKKVPAMIGAMLDAKIAGIRAQLAEAESLRKEAEALRGEYEAKLAALDTDAQAMRDRAAQEAEALVAKAKSDAEALVARRQRMAEERIAAAERAAVADVRDQASRAAVDAARTLIADGHGASADAPLVDRAIAELDRL